jgi:hypothetical protein
MKPLHFVTEPYNKITEPGNRFFFFEEQCWGSRMLNPDLNPKIFHPGPYIKRGVQNNPTFFLPYQVKLVQYRY